MPRRPLSGVIAGTPITINEWTLDAGHEQVSGDFSGDHPDLAFEPSELIGSRLMFLFFNGKKIVACGHAHITEISVVFGNHDGLKVEGRFMSREKWAFIG